MRTLTCIAVLSIYTQLYESTAQQCIQNVQINKADRETLNAIFLI